VYKKPDRTNKQKFYYLLQLECEVFLAYAMCDGVRSPGHSLCAVYKTTCRVTYGLFDAWRHCLQQRHQSGRLYKRHEFSARWLLI